MPTRARRSHPAQAQRRHMTTLAVPHAAAFPEPRVQTPEPRAASRFLVSAGYDACFSFASVLAVFAAWIAATRFGVNRYTTLATVAVVSDGPPLVSTWTRVYFDRREWQRRPVHIFAIPALIASAVAVTHL